MRTILKQEEDIKKTNMRKIVTQKENMKKPNIKKILNQKKKIMHKKIHKKNQKCLKKVEKFCQQIRQGPYFICTVCHQSFISAVSDYLNMENIIFLLQNFIVW